MRALKALLLLLPLTLPLSPAALAEEKPGRYTMSPTDGGFLRLDTQTGAVAFCTRRNDAWQCAGVADEPLALRREIEQLKARNAELEIEIKRLDELVGLRDKDGRAERPSLPGLPLPSEQDIDKGLDYLNRMFKRFREKLKEFDEPERKGSKI